jgi:hypothetical protein
MADLTHYPKTEQFEIIDTIGVPHPFCITDKHVAHASYKFGGILGESAIKDLEKITFRPSCGVKGCQLKYHEHKQALLIEVDDDRDLNDIPELNEYLLECKPICESDGYVGFAFKQK